MATRKLRSSKSLRRDNEDIELILASQSPRRERIMKYLGLKFRTLPSDFDERSVPLSRPADYVKTLATAKAKKVADEVGEAVVVAADTVLVKDNKILNKPKDLKEADEMLHSLSGTKVGVFTGLCVIDNYSRRVHTKSVITKVKFRKLEERTIRRYLEIGDVLTKSGAWNVEDDGSVFVENIVGDYTNIIGLPVPELLDILKKIINY